MIEKLYYKERQLSARMYLRVIRLKWLLETQFWKSNPLSFFDLILTKIPLLFSCKNNHLF